MTNNIYTNQSFYAQ